MPTATCSECRYNLPHHGRGCSLAPKTTAFCPDHMPSDAARQGSDDAQLRCSVCRVVGYHVRLALV